MEDRTILARHAIGVDIEAERTGINIKVSFTDRGNEGISWNNRQVVQRYLRTTPDAATFAAGLIGTVVEGVTAALDLSTDTLFDGMEKPVHDDWGVKVVQDGGMAGAKIVTPLEPRDFDAESE